MSTIPTMMIPLTISYFNAHQTTASSTNNIHNTTEYMDPLHNYNEQPPTICQPWTEVSRLSEIWVIKNVGKKWWWVNFNLKVAKLQRRTRQTIETSEIYEKYRYRKRTRKIVSLSRVHHCHHNPKVAFFLINAIEQNCQLNWAFPAWKRDCCG